MSSRGDGKRRCVNLRSDLNDWVHYGGERSLIFPNNSKSQGLVEGEKERKKAKRCDGDSRATSSSALFLGDDLEETHPVGSEGTHLVERRTRTNRRSVLGIFNDRNEENA